MRKASVLLAFATGISLSTAGLDVSAMGFGRIRTSAVLGQPLDLAVPVRLEEGETLTSGCVSAEVLVGEQMLAPGTVRTVVEQAGSGSDAGQSEAILRITTSVAMEEPVVTVTVSAGCPVRLTRRIVAFADPPGLPMAAAEVESVPLVLEPGPAGASRSGPGDSTVAAAEKPPRATPQPSDSSGPAARRRTPGATSSASTRAASAAARRSARAQPVARAPPPPPAIATTPLRPRLQLDSEDVVSSQLLAAQAQASAAQAAARDALAAASSAAASVQRLEQETARLRTDAQANRELMLQMRSRLVDAESAGRWLPWLLALLGLLLASVAWLGWRSSRARRGPPPWWDAQAPTDLASSAAVADAAEATDAAAPPDTAPAAPASGLADSPKRAAVAPADSLERSRTRPGALALAGLSESQGAASAAMPLGPMAMAAALAVPEQETAASGRARRREVSIEEQIDLEQQADFFIVLGQDDAAIDLLLSHLRSTGGTSPMPYLKLLEIHRRRGEREAYDRARSRFNQRFNGVAPEWETDPQHGRTLEDYPRVMSLLQDVWWSPLDAMAELESLLFRRGDDAELFDLPAYQEVLALYQLARDLHLHEAPPDTGHVDVLLPLIDGVDDAVSVRHVDLESTRVLQPKIDLELPELLDFDLTSAPVPHAAEEHAGHTIDFDFADTPPAAKSRF